MGSSRARGFGIVVLTYLAALALAIAVAAILGRDAPILTAFVADCAATLLVFAASVAFANASLYDPYWSVAPPLIGLYWVGAPAVPARQWLVLVLVFAWAIRLTANWARGWPGLHHQDWRYDMLRETASAPYWLVNLTGIHFFPTLIVFVGCLPLYAALGVGARPLGFLDGLAFAVTAGSIALEGIADEQLRAFNRTKQPGEICARGLWGWSRHPNYLGEMGFWWGLWLFALAAEPAWYWSAIGPLAITVMFVAASIPMLEKRSLERRPGYAEHAACVPAVLPRRPRVS